MKILFIGQAPSRGSQGMPPFSGECGKRLATLLSLSQDAMLEKYDFINVLNDYPGTGGKGDLFPTRAARVAAGKILLTESRRRERIVILGSGVARVFGLKQDVLRTLEWRRPCPGDPFFSGTQLLLALCPHPSGINRWWNDQDHVRMAMGFFSSTVFK